MDYTVRWIFKNTSDRSIYSNALGTGSDIKLNSLTSSFYKIISQRYTLNITSFAR